MKFSEGRNVGVICLIQARNDRVKREFFFIFYSRKFVFCLDFSWIEESKRRSFRAPPKL